MRVAVWVQGVFSWRRSLRFHRFSTVLGLFSRVILWLCIANSTAWVQALRNLNGIHGQALPANRPVAKETSTRSARRPIGLTSLSRTAVHGRRGYDPR